MSLHVKMMISLKLGADLFYRFLGGFKKIQAFLFFVFKETPNSV